MSTRIKLPDTEKELLKLAIVDLEACEEDPLYRINMAWWCAPQREFCAVCLAGSVMAKTLKNITFSFDSVRYETTPEDFREQLGKKESDKLYWLNEVRRGRIYNFDKHLEYAIIDVSEYCDHSEKFKAQIHWLADNWCEDISSLADQYEQHFEELD